MDVICYSCEEEIQDETITYDSYHFCSVDCLTNIYDVELCTECGTYEDKEDGTTDGNSNFYCASCKDDLIECECCKTLYKEDDLASTDDNYYICEFGNCASKVAECFACGEHIYKAEIIYGKDGGEYLCESCYDQDKAVACQYCNTILLTEDSLTAPIKGERTQLHFCDDYCADRSGYLLCPTCEELSESYLAITYKDAEYCSYSCANAKECACCGEAYTKENTSDYCSNLCAAEHGYLRCTTCSNPLTKDFVEYKIDTELYAAYCNENCKNAMECFICGEKHNEYEGYSADTYHFCTAICIKTYYAKREYYLAKHHQEEQRKAAIKRREIEHTFSHFIQRKCYRCIEGTPNDSMYERIQKIMKRFNQLSRVKLYRLGFIEKIENVLFYRQLDAMHVLYVGPLFAYVLERKENGAEKYYKVYDILVGDTLTTAHQAIQRFPYLKPFFHAMALRTNIEEYIN